MTHPAFAQLDHRPWPLPPGRWSWRQVWCDLLFLHWPIAPALLRPLIPPALTIDTVDGEAWLGIVPFRMEGVMRRPLPDLPGISAFPELNVRTYVRIADRPGVWFFSLDATSRLAVWAARRFFHLPYFNATIRCDPAGEGIAYSAERRDPRGGAAAFRADYRPVGEPVLASAGSLTHWLTERYALYAQSAKGQLYRGEVHHVQWPLQPAELMLHENRQLDWLGLSLPDTPPLVHFARRLEVAVWSLQACGSQ